MTKKILIIAATHGDENIGVQIIKKLQKTTHKNIVDLLIGNPRAYKLRKRYIDVDLNRAYPGKLDSSLYEEKIASRNLDIARKYSVVIDIHEASKSHNSFIIVPRQRIKNKKILESVGLDKIVLWPPVSSEKKGPLTQFVDNGFEIEFGTKGITRNKATDKIVKTITSFLRNIEPVYVKSGKRKQSIYRVYGKLSVQEREQTACRLKDFQITRIGREEFYPLLTNQYLKDNIACYKMTKT